MKKKRVTMDDAEEAFRDEWFFEQQQWAYYNIHHRSEKRDDREAES